METVTSEDRKVVLEASGIVKRFGGVTALRGVDLTLRKAEILALVGDNGAGKSTLVKILSGVHEPDEGSIAIGGKHVRLDSPQRAQTMGVATVYQDLALVNDRDVAHNLFLGREPCRYGFFVDARRMYREARETLLLLGVAIPNVRARVGGLSGGQKQAIAVARAWHQGGEIILLDEPTAALGVRETARITNLVKTLREEGHAQVLISHDMESVFSLADRIVVLRHGTKVADMRTSETNKREVVSLLTSGTL